MPDDAIGPIRDLLSRHIVAVGGFHQREDKEILTGQKMNICETTIPAHDRQKIGVGSSPSIPCPLSICLINSPLSLLFIFSLSPEGEDSLAKN
jgi:hypothetical protein